MCLSRGPADDQDLRRESDSLIGRVVTESFERLTFGVRQPGRGKFRHTFTKSLRHLDAYSPEVFGGDRSGYGELDHALGRVQRARFVQDAAQLAWDGVAERVLR